MSEPSVGAWHPDPSGRHELRYWDGANWTDHVSDGGVTGVDPMPPAPPAAYGYGVGRGPVGRTTNPGMQILLFIVTLGIWGAVWLYRQHEDIRKYTGEGMGGGLSVVIYLLAGIVSTFILTNEVETKLYQREGQESPVRTVQACWNFLPIIGNYIWYSKTQNAINDFWMARGAPAPT